LVKVKYIGEHQMPDTKKTIRILAKNIVDAHLHHLKSDPEVEHYVKIGVLHKLRSNHPEGSKEYNDITVKMHKKDSDYSKKKKAKKLLERAFTNESINTPGNEKIQEVFSTYLTEMGGIEETNIDYILDILSEASPYIPQPKYNPEITSRVPLAILGGIRGTLKNTGERALNWIHKGKHEELALKKRAAASQIVDNNDTKKKRLQDEAAAHDEKIKNADKNIEEGRKKLDKHLGYLDSLGDKIYKHSPTIDKLGRGAAVTAAIGLGAGVLGKLGYSALAKTGLGTAALVHAKKFIGGASDYAKANTDKIDTKELASKAGSFAAEKLLGKKKEQPIHKTVSNFVKEHPIGTAAGAIASAYLLSKLMKDDDN